MLLENIVIQITENATYGGFTAKICMNQVLLESGFLLIQTNA